jgi:hypothetical protein
MESITRNVKDLADEDRRNLEDFVGQHLQDNQQVIIKVITVGTQPANQQPEGAPAQPLPSGLPDYCNVYDGLSDDEITELEELILDRSESRSTSSPA